MPGCGEEGRKKYLKYKWEGRAYPKQEKKYIRELGSHSDMKRGRESRRNVIKKIRKASGKRRLPVQREGKEKKDKDIYKFRSYQRRINRGERAQQGKIWGGKLALVWEQLQ